MPAMLNYSGNKMVSNKPQLHAEVFLLLLFFLSVTREDRQRYILSNSCLVLEKMRSVSRNLLPKPPSVSLVFDMLK